MAVARYQDAIATADDPQVTQAVRPSVGETYLEWASVTRKAGRYQDAIDTCAAAMDAFPEAGWHDQMHGFILDTYLQWADEQRQEGAYEQAIVICRAAIDAFPQADWHDQMHATIRTAYLEWATWQYDEGDYEAAIATYHERLDAYPAVEADAIHAQIGVIYSDWAEAAWEAEDYPGALGVYEELIDAYPKSEEAERARSELHRLYYDWADEVYRNADYAAAVSHYGSGIQLEAQALGVDATAPSEPSTYRFTVNTESLNVRSGPGTDQPVVKAVEQGDKIKAVSRSADGQWLQVTEPAGWVYASLVTGDTPVSDLPLEGDVSAPSKPPVVEASSTAARAWEALARAYYEWGLSLHREGEYQEAIERFQTVVDEYPASQVISDTRVVGGQAYLAYGDELSADEAYEEAETAYGKAIEVDPTDENVAAATDGIVDVYLAWAKSYQDENEYSSAVDKYTVVYTTYPNHARTVEAYSGVVACYTEWGDQLRGGGRYSDAIEKYEAIITRFPQSSQVGPAAIAIGESYNLWGASLHKRQKYIDAMAKYSLAWKATSDANVVAAAQKGYNDALWTLARLTNATGKQIMNDALATACRGQAAASPAINLATGEPGKGLVSQAWFTLPADLAATMPAHFRYAVCLTSGSSEVQRCSYTGFHTLVRQRQWWRVVVRNAKTGGEIASQTFHGSYPASCPQRRGFRSSVDYVSGGAPSAQDVIAWLRGIIK